MPEREKISGSSSLSVFRAGSGAPVRTGAISASLVLAPTQSLGLGPLAAPTARLTGLSPPLWRLLVLYPPTQGRKDDADDGGDATAFGFRWSFRMHGGSYSFYVSASGRRYSKSASATQVKARLGKFTAFSGVVTGPDALDDWNGSTTASAVCSDHPAAWRSCSRACSQPDVLRCTMVGW